MTPSSKYVHLSYFLNNTFITINLWKIVKPDGLNDKPESITVFSV